MLLGQVLRVTSVCRAGRWTAGIGPCTSNSDVWATGGVERGERVAQVANGLVIDLRGVTPSMRRPLVFAVIDRMVDLECEDSMVVICDHDPSGLRYQLDLRRESRGMFEFDCDQRLDGAWVALIRRRLR
ncbi:MAG TPA: DUF2249 domain-containing protein [Actinobacteria bacterium]|nr:DUF2249 domain-containing protein [Actinomycetota bacterium]